MLTLTLAAVFMAALPLEILVVSVPLRGSPSLTSAIHTIRPASLLAPIHPRLLPSPRKPRHLRHLQPRHIIMYPTTTATPTPINSPTATSTPSPT